MKRSTKFYRKNEKEVMEYLGFNPTTNSGAGWIQKSDGENETCLCELKSTDNESISVKLRDIDTLKVNASVSHKIPVFAINFIQRNETFILVHPDDLIDVADALRGKEVKPRESIIDHVETTIKQQRIIKSSKNARERYNEKNKYKEREKKA